VEIYQLGISAAAIGKTHEAVTFLKVAKLKVPPTDMEYVEKIDKNLAKAGIQYYQTLPGSLVKPGMTKNELCNVLSS
jgi:hypothetical protein